MLKLFSPAKINLFLRIVNRRPDHYHNLSSLFQAISLGDHITFNFHSHDHLSCSEPSIPTDQQNLILKATQLFRQKTGCRLHLKIYLEKKIPIEAGLGGGSSNAATTLWAMNFLSGLNVPQEKIIEWAGEIGSDVAFFLSKGTAYCSERGEKIHPIKPLSCQNLWIVKPFFGCSTSKVYQQLAVSENAMKHQDLEDIYANKWCYFNDFEAVVLKLNPELKKIKLSLYACGFKTVLLCGSGSAFFCIGDGNICLLEQNKNLLSFAAKYINRSDNEWYKEQF